MRRNFPIISRQDLITLTYRAFVALGYIDELSAESGLEKFIDGVDVADYAVTAMNVMIKRGVIVGDGDMLRPQSDMTRAECAAMCSRLLDVMADSNS